MKITPYTGIDDLMFNDGYEAIKAKLTYEFEETVAEEMDKVYPVLYVQELDLLIQFNENMESIRYFEFLQPSLALVCEDVVLSGDYVDVLNQMKTLDADGEITDDAFTSAKLGVTVSRQLEDGLYSNKVEGVVVFSKEYFNEPEPDEDDFLKFHLGYNPFED